MHMHNKTNCLFKSSVITPQFFLYFRVHSTPHFKGFKFNSISIKLIFRHWHLIITNRKLVILHEKI